MNKIAQERNNLLEALKLLTGSAKEEYDKLTTPEKIVFIMTEDHGFLETDQWFSGSAVGHRDVSLYDDFYWERHQTNSTFDLLTNHMDNWPENDYDKPFQEQALDYANWLVEQEDSKAATLVHLAENGIREATYDW